MFWLMDWLLHSIDSKLAGWLIIHSFIHSDLFNWSINGRLNKKLHILTQSFPVIFIIFFVLLKVWNKKLKKQRHIHANTNAHLFSGP